MDARFRSFIDALHPKYVALMSMQPVTVATLPKLTPKGGVYLFSHGTRHLYAGRTKRMIGARVRDHVSSARDCPFAWRLARKATGNVDAAYKKEGSREHLLSQKTFVRAYEKAKAYIRTLMCDLSRKLIPSARLCSRFT